MSCATSDYRDTSEIHQSRGKVSFFSSSLGSVEQFFITSFNLTHLAIYELFLLFLDLWMKKVQQSFLVSYLSAFPLKLNSLSRRYRSSINFLRLKSLRAKSAKTVYSRRFFNPGATATGFKTLPLRIESSNCSRGDGLRFNGANFLSVAC